MNKRDVNFLSKYKIGIIGCGHLGRTLAKTLIDNNFPKENLRVSYGGSSSTLESIANMGLLNNVTGNNEICMMSDLIFIAIRPQDFKELGKILFRKQAIIVSCMAGISTGTFKSILGIDVFRIMPSGPDTIQANKGIVALYPDQDILKEILSKIGFKVFEIPNEEIMHIFTVGVCLPAGLLAANKNKLLTDTAIRVIGEEYPGFGDIYNWAINVLPVLSSDKEQEEYIHKMITKGGITESILDSIYSGDEFVIALTKGIIKSKELAERINRVIVGFGNHGS